MTDLRLESAYAGATAVILDAIRQSADALATAYHEDNATVLATLWSRLAGSFTTGTRGDTDGRTARWRCRFRIYRADAQDDPVADSDAELPADRPGTAVIAGLPGVAEEVVELAKAFHQPAIVAGLSREELTRRLKGLRPTLSRNKGSATWRLDYSTIENRNERTTERGWLMRVDISRETEATGQ